LSVRGSPEENPRSRGEGIETAKGVDERRHGSDLLRVIHRREVIKRILGQELKELLGLRTGRRVHGKEGRSRRQNFNFLSGELRVGIWLRLGRCGTLFTFPLFRRHQQFIEPSKRDHDGVGSVTEIIARLDGLAIPLDAVELLLGDDEREEDAILIGGLQFLEPWAAVAVTLRGVVSPSPGGATDPSEKRLCKWRNDERTYLALLHCGCMPTKAGQVNAGRRDWSSGSILLKCRFAKRCFCTVEGSLPLTISQQSGYSCSRAYCTIKGSFCYFQKTKTREHHNT
jgi:hypothetical protein